MAPEQRPDEPGVDGQAGERDPADIDGFDLEALWQLCTPSPGKPRHDPLIGVEFNGVRLSRVLGEGGMGRVYEGHSIDGSGKVAVKVLRPGLWSDELLRRFAKESEILRRLDHPGISKILAVGVCEVIGTPVPAIVMELVPRAAPITDWVRKHAPDLDGLRTLFGKVCDAVAHGHSQGIVHRDLKPGNILVGETGEPKVIDFGVARGISKGTPESTLTAPGGFVGTLQYMSPEQVESDGATVDARSDVHTLGAILHELLTGQPPWDVARMPVVEAARTIRESPAPRAAAAPPRLAAVIARCLEKNPKRRYHDAGELAAALRATAVAGGRWTFPSWPRFPRLAGKPPRRREIVRGTFLGLLVGAILLFAIQAVRDWGGMERSLGAIVDGTAALTARLQASESLVFEHGFRTVEQADAGRWLVSSDGMRIWSEDFSTPRISYWGPAENGVEGTLVYRFQFPVVAERIELHAEAMCWDFASCPELGQGRGAAKVEVSPDGNHWITLHDSIGAGTWGGASWWNSGDLPAGATGTRSLWLRVRLVAEGVDDPDYTVAQFARSHTATTADAFSIKAFARGVPETLRIGR